LRWLRILIAAPLIILAMPIALMAGIFFKGRNSTPAELPADLQKLADGTEGDRDWDELESVPLKNPRLEEIRRAAVALAPPGPINRVKLAELAQQARNLS
jgi:hypothetical protein